MSFLSQKREREEFPLQQVSSKGARPCVKLISYLCFALFCKLGKDTHPHILRPWEPFLLVYWEKTLRPAGDAALTHRHRRARDKSAFSPSAFVLWWREKTKAWGKCWSCVRISELMEMRGEEEEVALRKRGGVVLSRREEGRGWGKQKEEWNAKRKTEKIKPSCFNDTKLLSRTARS